MAAFPRNSTPLYTDTNPWGENPHTVPLQSAWSTRPIGSTLPPKKKEKYVLHGLYSAAVEAEATSILIGSLPSSAASLSAPSFPFIPEYPFIQSKVVHPALFRGLFMRSK